MISMKGTMVSKIRSSQRTIDRQQPHEGLFWAAAR
jgi:hypothetical protein